MDIAELAEPVALSVLAALPNPVFVLGEDGCIELANAATEDFFQTSASRLRTRNFDYYLPEDSPARSLIAQVRRERSAVNGYRVDLSSPHLESARNVDIHITPLHDRPGRLLVMLQIRSMAETLDRQMTHRGAARSVTGLAAMLAHEIKNPLAGIRGAAQLLETNGSQDDRALTRLITEETDRIVRLVDRMEVFSDERPVERDPVNIHAVLEQVKRAAQSGFAQNVEIVELYDPSLPPVSGDRDQLVQVILNLVKNACEAMTGVASPKLTLKTAFRPGMRVAARGSGQPVSLPIALTVEDNGEGIAADMQSYMFDPFITTKTNGTGLGLALVAKIVGDHGGVISCTSKPGETVFTILLPMVDAEKPPAGTASGARHEEKRDG